MGIKEKIVYPALVWGALSLPTISFANEKSQEFSEKVENILSPIDNGKKLRKQVSKLESEYKKDLENVFKSLSVEQKDSLTLLYANLLKQ